MAAIGAGANALGFIFWPQSPRRMDVDAVQRIVSVLPPFVTAVGVFVDQAVDEVNRIADRVNLGAIQLHGNESLEYVREIERPVIKAVAVAGDASTVPDTWPDKVRLLLDVHDPVRRGGTGRIIDWVAASALAAQREVILAGGLTPDNIRDAINQVRPWGIDVSSGVESAPGIKDHERIKALFEAVHGSRIPARS